METSPVLFAVALVLFVSSVPFVVRAALRGKLDRNVIAAAALLDGAAVAIVAGAFLRSGAGALRIVLVTVPWPLVLAAGWLLWRHQQTSGEPNGR